MANAFGIDIGYHSVKLYLPDGDEPFVREPSVLALNGNDTVAACGKEAMSLVGRVPGTVRLIHPFSGETTPEAVHAKAFLSYLIKKYRLRGYDLYFALSGEQDDETEAVFVEAAQRAGIRDVSAVDTAYAAAAGCRVASVTESAVVNVGASVTDMACFCRGKTVARMSCGYGGNTFDRAASSYLFKKYRLALTPEETERIKRIVGTLSPTDEKSAEVSALRAAVGLPKKLVVTDTELAVAFEKVFDRLADEILRVVRPLKLEPDKIILTGGGASLDGFAEALSPVVGLPVVVADEPESAVIRGIAAMIKAKKTKKKGSSRHE